MLTCCVAPHLDICQFGKVRPKIKPNAWNEDVKIAKYKRNNLLRKSVYLVYRYQHLVRATPGFLNFKSTSLDQFFDTKSIL